MVLLGTEVKSLRAGKASIQEAFVDVQADGLELINAHIPPYEMGGHDNHAPRRKRRLLVHKSELEKMRKGVERKGYTIVPIKLYFRNGVAKIQIALGRGKKQHDKRTDIAEQETQRRLDRIQKDYNR